MVSSGGGGILSKCFFEKLELQRPSRPARLCLSRFRNLLSEPVSNTERARAVKPGGTDFRGIVQNLHGQQSRRYQRRGRLAYVF